VKELSEEFQLPVSTSSFIPSGKARDGAKSKTLTWKPLASKGVSKSFAVDKAVSSAPVNAGPSAFHVFKSSANLCDFKQREAKGEIADCECEYGRYRQAEWIALERALARLEGAESALSFPSGMAAITNLFDALCPTQTEPVHVIATAQGYRKTRSYLAARALAPQFELTLLQPEDFINLFASDRFGAFS
jgi:cystathionine beta-lyase/cystathionine gamma-synthase